ncbi:MAG: type II toxin-antitoxin system VapC family toxin [Verrucomicrobia bacterium]|nr:type II toxin-antitoxin system VapC family toxin [Verrucomicrobiota bacterium]
MGIIIDTSAIIELERGSGDWDGLLEASAGEEVFVAAATWGELNAGVHLADSVERALSRKAKLNALKNLVPVLPFTEELAEIWAELLAELYKKGNPISANDLAVITTAVFHGHRVLVSSKGEAHFRAVKRLEVMTL